MYSYDREKQSDGTVPLDSARGGGEMATDSGLDWSNVDPDLVDTVGIATHRLTMKVGDVVVP